MIRLVIDTNVFVAGLRSADGASRAVLRRILDGRYQPLDTLREKNLLEDLWLLDKAPWKQW